MATSMLDVLTKYDLTLENVLSTDSLKRLVTVHKELCESLSAETETQQAREKAIRDDMREAWLNNDHVTTLGIELRNKISDLMAEHPDSSVVIVELLQQIKSDTLTFRDFHVSATARANKPEKVKDADEVAERKDEANQLRDTIEAVWNMLGKPRGVIPMKENKKGEPVPDLVRIPGGNSTGKVGRGAVVRQMQFTIDGERCPEDIIFYDVLQNYVNNFAAGQVVKVADFWKIVEDAGFEQFPKGYDNRWTVEVFGMVIEGWVPTDED